MVAELPDLECCQPFWTNRTWEMLPAFLDEPDLGMLPAFLDEPGLGIENDPDYEAKDSHVLLQDITTLSADIYNITIDDIEAEFFEINQQSKQHKASTKIRRPKTSCSLATHLSGIHGITKEIAIKYEEKESRNPPEPSVKSYKHSVQESLTKNVIEFIIRTVQPLNVVEDPDFIRMIKGFDKRYKVPCTKTIKNAWSSLAHLPYLGVTAHWITSDFEPYEVLLSMKELPYLHGATEIQEHLIDLFYEWEIESKIIALVTDNSSNVKKACSKIGIGERIPCSAHTLQLSIGKGLDKIKQLVDKSATHLLSGVNYPTIVFTYPCICNLREKLETEFISLKTSDAKYCRNAILEDLTSRWNFFQKLCLKGSFFDPRFKSLDFINSQEECDNIFSQLREEFMIFKQNEQINNSTSSADKDTDDLMTDTG
ncbi:zinc finger BED domain-containing protein 4-like [Rhizophagus clarus]|uniref:Zinc finger BED domain-containing protein 4-like n=1 Tax=Rhizophagus clarus TaxID=94130 RepID=A0A8H3LMP8_9GLOM|nr:zinc finger BED domain-containing protein 4-like [Rhizophagus clarus]